jgi:hypothetical protein
MLLDQRLYSTLYLRLVVVEVARLVAKMVLLVVQVAAAVP